MTGAPCDRLGFRGFLRHIYVSNEPYATRTHDTLLKRQVLYLAELTALNLASISQERWAVKPKKTLTRTQQGATPVAWFVRKETDRRI